MSMNEKITAILCEEIRKQDGPGCVILSLDNTHVVIDGGLDLQPIVRRIVQMINMPDREPSG